MGPLTQSDTPQLLGKVLGALLLLMLPFIGMWTLCCSPSLPGRRAPLPQFLPFLRRGKLAATHASLGREKALTCPKSNARPMVQQPSLVYMAPVTNTLSGDGARGWVRDHNNKGGGPSFLPSLPLDPHLLLGGQDSSPLQWWLR